MRCPECGNVMEFRGFVSNDNGIIIGTKWECLECGFKV